MALRPDSRLSEGKRAASYLTHRPRQSMSRRTATLDLRLLRIEFALPRTLWSSSLTRNHPECRVEVTDRTILKSRRMLTEARLFGPDTGEWVREIARIPSVERIEASTPDGSNQLVWVTHKISAVTDLCRELEVVPRRPYWVAHGVTTWEVLGSAAALRRFVDRLSHTVFSVRVEALAPVGPDLEPSALTGRQLQLFRRAMEDGYFEVPRRVSLTDLAGRVNLSKSTLSRTLAVAERKLIQSAERFGLLSELGSPAGRRGEERVPSLVPA